MKDELRVMNIEINQKATEKTWEFENDYFNC